jgi:hypothetical protein
LAGGNFIRRYLKTVFNIKYDSFVKFSNNCVPMCLKRTFLGR